MYVIILAEDASHFFSKALHQNRKWHPARMSRNSSPGGVLRLPRANQRSSSTRRLTSVTYRRWTGPTYNTVLASSVDAAPTYAPITDVNPMSNRHRGWP